MWEQTLDERTLSPKSGYDNFGSAKIKCQPSFARAGCLTQRVATWCFVSGCLHIGGGQKISCVYMQSILQPLHRGVHYLIICQDYLKMGKDVFWRLMLFYSYFLQSFNVVGLKLCKAFANKGRWSVYVVQSTTGMRCDTYPATPTFKAGYSYSTLGPRLRGWSNLNERLYGLVGYPT